MKLDHIVLAVADLGTACDAFAEATGCTPALGGPHPGLGTHNALVGFRQGSYLEIIAPDPAQPHKSTMSQALGKLTEPALLHWALASTELERQRQLAEQLSYTPTAILDTARVQPDGQRLEWQLMGLSGHDQGGCIPFFIDWCGCQHPSTTSPTVGELLEFRVAMPDPDRLSALAGVVPGVVIEQGPTPALALRFASSKAELSFSTETPLGFSFSR